jgi:protease PrsW
MHEDEAPGSLPPPAVVPAPAAAPGWYPDPWSLAPYRWWDGGMWTASITWPSGRAGTLAGGGAVTGAPVPEERRPRLPAWLSPPVLVSAVLVVPLAAISVALEPVILLLALVPLFLVLPVLMWIDRLEPEPRAARFHAFAWGATVAVLVAVIANTIVGLTLGEAAAAVVSAPLVEETMKGLAVVWAVRRREVDGVVDGIVYAGWAGAGFAMVENLEFFLVAADEGALATTFVLRGILTPFAHPLFTMWIGAAIGLAVARRGPGSSRVPSFWHPRRGWWWGWVLAVVLHASWNGSLVWAGETGSGWILVGAALSFVAVFGGAIGLVVKVRRAERDTYLAMAPTLVAHYGLSPAEVGVVGSWRELLTVRRGLPRSERRRFDQMHAALARLAALHARPAGVDRSDEALLVDQLQRARRAPAER